MATLMDGKKLSKKIKNEISEEVAQLLKDGKRKPGLAVIIVGEDPASKVYVKNKIKSCKRVGIESHEYRLKGKVSKKELKDVIKFLNKDDEIDGILLQLPLPKHLPEEELLNLIDYKKDVDGFHPINVGNLFLNRETIKSCTPYGVIELLKHYEIDIKGKNCVVVGRSNIVGKPMAHMLLQNDATVTICHSKTQNLQEIISRGDIVVVAVGRAEMVKKEWLKKDAVVVDVGMNRVDKKLVGDVERGAEDVASYITPVPGGVGPMTIAMLLKNTLKCYKNRDKK